MFARLPTKGKTMTPQQFVGVGVRLFAVWLALSGVRLIMSAPEARAMIGEDTAFLLPMGTGIFYLVVSLTLWFFPMAIAHKLVPKTNHTNTLTSSAIEVARVGCCLLGLWLLTAAIPPLFWYVFRAVLNPQVGPFFSGMDVNQKADFAVRLFEIVIAVLLIVRSGVVARLILRSGDAANETQASAPPSA
jgi:hypothetical protein